MPRNTPRCFSLSPASLLLSTLLAACTQSPPPPVSSITGGGGPGDMATPGAPDMSGGPSPGNPGNPGNPGSVDMSPLPDTRPGGKITLTHSGIYIQQFSMVQYNWDAEVTLTEPVTPPATTQVAGCTVTPAAASGRALDAGDVSIKGGANGDVLFQRDPDTGLYAIPDNPDANDTSDGSLFTASSTLQVSAKGGADIKSLTQAGAWHGVPLLSFKSPQSLDPLPDADVALTWTAAPAPGVRMEVLLQARDGSQITCPMAADTGAYTLKKEVIEALPAGTVYLFVSRVFSTTAATAPDHGAVTLESRSQWQILSHK